MEQTGNEPSLVSGMGYMTEAEFLKLTGYTPGTAAAMRKRRQGPAFSRVGKNYYYPKEGVQKFMASRIKEPREQAMAGVL